MKFNKIFVDISNLYHRAFATSSHLTFKLPDGTSVVTGGIFTSVQMIKKLVSTHLSENGTMYFLFDYTHVDYDKNSSDKKSENYEENLRKNIDPEYKANRVAKTDASTFFYGLNVLQMILLNFHEQFVIVKIPGYEADDLVKPFLDEAEGSNDNILLASNDLDWARGIKNNIYWLKNDEIYDEERFYEIYGFYPKNNSLTLYKAFRGDSDNVPAGVPRIREKVLVRLVSEFDSLDEIIRSVDKLSYLGDVWREKILENKNRLKLNYRLIDYMPIPSDVLESHITSCSFNAEALRYLYKSVGFRLSKIDERLMKIFPGEEDPKNFFGFEYLNRV